MKSLYPAIEEKWWENDQKDLKTLHQLTCLTPPERIVKGCQYQLKCEWKKEISRYFQLSTATATRSNIIGELFPDLFQMENYFRAKA